MNPELKEQLLRVRWWIFHMNRRQIRRWTYQVTRPASYPYISGDGFRRLANHIYDETGRRVRPERVKDGDIVFVCTDYIDEFFESVDPRIPKKYKLITHNSIVPVDERLLSGLSDKILVWYAKNNTVEHERVVPIPLGLENLWCYNVGVPSDFDAMKDYSGPRRNRILCGFTVATNTEERGPVAELATQAPLIARLPSRLGQRDYLRTLVTYKFLLSPPGSGLDANRTWEAMYLGVVPIVKDSVAMRYFRSLGLPLWIVESWEVLLSLREEDLASKYEDLRAGFRSSALYMNYWSRRIKEW